MFDRRLLLAAAAATAFLLVASGASADPVNTFAGVSAPSHVKPVTSASYTVGLTNDASSPEAADRAKIAIPPGFAVDAVQATTSAAGVCQSSTWIADGDLIADGKINLTRPGLSPSDELCPGATLTVVFSATSPGAEGIFTWTSELLRGVISFALAGAQPTVQVDGTAPEVAITAAPGNPSNDGSPSFAFDADEPALFQCSVDGAPFLACFSPQTYIALGAGAHQFSVKATDLAGNEGPATSYGWTIDTTAPTT
ncbi:MAG TPA: hypothetical protein VGW30_04475, partial [Gaiellaceae bacterium]|nr:hypothetical protein [Gaiellaceae bacterium]